MSLPLDEEGRYLLDVDPDCWRILVECAGEEGSEELPVAARAFWGALGVLYSESQY